MFVTDVKFISVNPAFRKQFVSKIVKPWALVRWNVTLVKEEHPENTLVAIRVTLLGIVIWFNVEHPWNALEFISVTVPGIVTWFKTIQSWNMLLGIVVILLRNVTLIKAGHPRNILLPMLVTVLGIIIWFNVEHPWNALEFIVFTVVGISGVSPATLTAELNPVIACLVASLKTKKKSTTALFKTIMVIPAVIKLLVVYPMVYMFITGDKVVIVNFTFKKQSVPKLVKPWALVRSSVRALKLVHPENAELPMLATLVGIVRDGILLQPENAKSPMLVRVLIDWNWTEVKPLQPENAELPIVVTLL